MENAKTQEIDDAVEIAGQRVEKAITTLQQQVKDQGTQGRLTPVPFRKSRPDPVGISGTGHLFKTMRK